MTEELGRRQAGHDDGVAAKRSVLSDPWLLGAGAAVALGAAAVFVQRKVWEAEAENPPRGQFVEVDGVRLHYVVRGKGKPIVLLHGNGALVRDFELSGLVSRLAKNHRVFVFDRPGYGYSSRPRHRIWTPEAQAELFAAAFDELGIEKPVVVGHSWGALVTVALGLDHPDAVSRLVLLSGYFYPSARADVVLMAPPSIPVVGDLMRYTVSPLISRAIWHALTEKLFSPNPIPAKFKRLPIWMVLRPGQIRAAAAEAALMVPAAYSLSDRYEDLHTPTLIMAGEGDLQVTTVDQSERLHEDIAGSELKVLPEVGHMIHHVATKEVADAIERFARPRGKARAAA